MDQERPTAVPAPRALRPELEDKAAILSDVARAIEEENLDAGRRLLANRYPFTPVEKTSRRYTERRSLQLFYRDGFLDRYSGARLVNPGALRLLSVLMPDDFPADPNWAMSRSHFAFWELFPSIDHLHPVSRGGEDSESNWMTTSMLRNSAKAHWTLGELGWTLHPPGDHTVWDGLTSWFIRHLRSHHDPLRVPYIKRWFLASVEISAEAAAGTGFTP
jgi:5-methylcytosine-specific restriction endonuclease McrA